MLVYNNDIVKQEIEEINVLNHLKVIRFSKFLIGPDRAAEKGTQSLDRRYSKDGSQTERTQQGEHSSGRIEQTA